jgi:phage gp29-like protein
VTMAKAILGPDGRPAFGADRVRIEKQNRFNPLRGFTPDVLTRQLEAYQRGDIAQLAWVMEWLEAHDDTIATVAPKAKAAVSRYGYDVALKDEITPEQKAMADDQAAKLQTFYQSIETGDALDLDEAGGMRLLAHQVMDGYGKGYAAHHIIWRRTSAGLTARLIQVPLWFFEARTGRLRFLSSPHVVEGVDLATMGGLNAWMVTKGRGVMLAGTVARTFKQIPLQDWLTYCDRHGMPMFLGKTGAEQNSAGWNQMASAVAGIGAEYGAVINTGDAIEVINLAASGETPYKDMIERMDRAQVMLWRGGDLGTMSRESGVGSNPQQEDADELDADNAAWVSETINRNLTSRVVAYYFGPDAPVLCELRMRTRTRDNLTQDLGVVTAAKEMGVRVSESWFLSKFNVVKADDGERALGDAVIPPAGSAATNAINSGENDKLLSDSLAKALGVRSAVLDPISEMIGKLEAQAKEEGIDDATWLQFVEDAAGEIPELFDPAQAGELAGDLEAAMGTSALIGVRDSLKKQS